MALKTTTSSAKKKEAHLENLIGPTLAKKYSHMKKKNRECSLYGVLVEDRHIPAQDATF